MNIVIGIGCDRGTPLSTLEAVLKIALKKVNCRAKQIQSFATIDKKMDEVSINILIRNMKKPINYYSARELAQVEVPNPSDVVMKYMGTPAVSEAAAMLAANTNIKNLLLLSLF